jgi:hypothetical protein
MEDTGPIVVQIPDPPKGYLHIRRMVVLTVIYLMVYAACIIFAILTTGILNGYIKSRMVAYAIIMIITPLPLVIMILMRIFRGIIPETYIIRYSVIWMIFGSIIQLVFGLVSTPNDRLVIIFFWLSNVMLFILIVMKFTLWYNMN